MTSRRLPFACWLLLVLLVGRVSISQNVDPPPGVPRSIFDPKLQALRKASVTWDVKRGPDRQVVDLVCLVPDVPTFLEAVKTWDREHYFPILIDDVELNLRFIRAFRPARVVRYPSRADPIPAAAAMKQAIDAVGHAWREPGSDRGLPGDKVPALKTPATPGIVVSKANSPSLAAAVALAAGRFEPLVEWSWNKSHNEALDEAGAVAAADALTALVMQTIPQYLALGDACDFITLAGEWPFQYRSPQVSKGGVNALDDLYGRDPRDGTRCAFVGRLIGRPEQCVYQAMCSLFLTADSATLFDTYDPKAPTWAPYSMEKIRPGLSKVLKMKIWPASAGPGPEIWHAAFGPVNQAGFVMVNTHGDSDQFNLPTNRGRTADIPFSVPTAVHFLHSYSAVNPYDRGTLAHRWMANGAYAYYGSMNEPYLDAFRTPELIADLLTFNLPLVAAFRKLPPESFSSPWRLMFFGDPLCRLRPVKAPGPRLATWPAVDRWDSYPSKPDGPPPAEENARLAWALKLALGSAASPPRDPQTSSVLFEALSKLPRGRLHESLHPILDALCVEVYLDTQHVSALRSRLAAIPDGELSADNRRWRDTVSLIDLDDAVRVRDVTRAGVIWETLVRSDTSPDLKLALIDRLTPFFVRMNRAVSWSERVHAAAPQFTGTSAETSFLATLKKLDSKTAPAR